jgi:hypothetical protein
MGEMRSVYKIFVGKPEGKRLFGRRRHRWEDSSRKDLRDIWRCGLHSCGSSLKSVADSCEHGNEPSGSMKSGELVD